MSGKGSKERDQFNRTAYAENHERIFGIRKLYQGQPSMNKKDDDMITLVDKNSNDKEASDKSVTVRDKSQATRLENPMDKEDYFKEDTK